MLDSNDSNQEFSAAQSDDKDGCLRCGQSIQAVTRRGPGEVVVQPCGHDVADTLARDFPRTGVDA